MDMTTKDKAALELAMNMLANDRQWGPALQERLAGKRYSDEMVPIMGD